MEVQESMKAGVAEAGVSVSRSMEHVSAGVFRPLTILVVMENRKLIQRSPDILGGTPVFAGTRVPIQTLIDYVEAGDSADDFLDDFPSVSRKQVLGALQMAK